MHAILATQPEEEKEGLCGHAPFAAMVWEVEHPAPY